MARFWTECYQAHFQKRFQKPFDIQVFHDADGTALKIAIHDWALRGYRVYASMGLADKLVAREEEDFGEVILLSDVPDEAVPRLFVNALFFILQHAIPLGSRFAIGGIDRMQPDFAHRHGKSALYFTRPLDSDDEEDEPSDDDLKTAITAEPGARPARADRNGWVRNGESLGCVYQAYFIAPEENRYLDANGPDAFEELLRAQEIGRDSVRRPSCV